MLFLFFESLKITSLKYSLHLWGLKIFAYKTKRRFLHEYLISGSGAFKNIKYLKAHIPYCEN